MKSVVRIALRLGTVQVVQNLLASDEAWQVQAALNALEPLPGVTVDDVFNACRRLRSKGVHSAGLQWADLKESALRAVRRVATPTDIPVLKDALQASRKAGGPWTSSNPRELLLAIRENGAEGELKFILDFFLNAPTEIKLSNRGAVFAAASQLAGPGHIPWLTELMKSPEFWTYYSADARPEIRIPVANLGNIHLFKCVVGFAYAKAAGRRELPTLRKMLRHDYWWIRHAAADAIIRLARTADLTRLVEGALSPPAEHDALIKVLNVLDRRFHKP